MKRRLDCGVAAPAAGIVLRPEADVDQIPARAEIVERLEDTGSAAAEGAKKPLLPSNAAGCEVKPRLAEHRRHHAVARRIAGNAAAWSWCRS